jgi:quercetin dioxygenase-like cupin family protein
MFVRQWSQAEWKPAGYEGGERAILRLSPEQGRTSLVRLKAGARGPRHRHAGGEDVLVISGRIRVDGHELGPGDYLYAEAGEEHEVVALEDAMFFASTQKPVQML